MAGDADFRARPLERRVAEAGGGDCVQRYRLRFRLEFVKTGVEPAPHSYFHRRGVVVAAEAVGLLPAAERDDAVAEAHDGGSARMYALLFADVRWDSWRGWREEPQTGP